MHLLGQAGPTPCEGGNTGHGIVGSGSHCTGAAWDAFCVLSGCLRNDGWLEYCIVFDGDACMMVALRVVQRPEWVEHLSCVFFYIPSPIASRHAHLL